MSKQTAGTPTAPWPFGTVGNPFSGALTPQLDAVGKGHEHAVQAWMQMNRAVLEGVGKLQQETSRFVIRRLEEDLDRHRQLLTCRSPEDALQIVSDAARQTVQDYTDEVGRLSEIAAEVQYACSGFGELLAGSTVEAKTADGATIESQDKPGRKTAA